MIGLKVEYKFAMTNARQVAKLTIESKEKSSLCLTVT